MPAESLALGYKLVESFGPNSEYETRPSVNPGVTGDGGEEVEEEVEYVTLEISGIADVDPNLLTSYRLIGVDTPTPFLQLSSSGTIFKGRHHKLLGTELLFSHAQGDSDPSARHMSLLGTTEQRIVFSPVEVRNPASSSTTSKVKTPRKESSSKKGKKKANVGASGIEDVAGSLNPTVEPGRVAHSMTGGGKEDRVEQDGGDDDDMYATEGDGEVDEGGGDGTLEVKVGDEGEIGADTNADLPPRKKRRPARNDKEKTAARFTGSPTTGMTPATVAEPNVAQVQHQQGTLPARGGVPIAIDPALQTLQVPTTQPFPQASGSGGGI